MGQDLSTNETTTNLLAPQNIITQQVVEKAFAKMFPGAADITINDDFSIDFTNGDGKKSNLDSRSAFLLCLDTLTTKE